MFERGLEVCHPKYQSIAIVTQQLNGKTGHMCTLHLFGWIILLPEEHMRFWQAFVVA